MSMFGAQQREEAIQRAQNDEDADRLRWLIDCHEKGLWNLLWNGRTDVPLNTIREAIDYAMGHLALDSPG